MGGAGDGSVLGAFRAATGGVATECYARRTTAD